MRFEWPWLLWAAPVIGLLFIGLGTLARRARIRAADAWGPTLGNEARSLGRRSALALGLVGLVATAAAALMKIFDEEHIIENDLVFIGSPETVTEKLHRASETGLSNTFMGEFIFADLAEDDLMRSIRLFGEKVMPELRAFEPY